MALVMGRLYEALRSANVPDVLAREAAAEVARPVEQLAVVARGSSSCVDGGRQPSTSSQRL